MNAAARIALWVACAWLVPSPLVAQWWPGRLPATHYVDKTNEGSDPRDSALRRAAAYAVLQDFVKTGAGSHASEEDSIPQDVRARFGEYVAAERSLIEGFELAQDEVSRLADDFVFRQRLITAYFDGTDRERYLKRVLGARLPSGSDTASMDLAFAEGQLRALYAGIPAPTKLMFERYALTTAAPLLLMLVFGAIAAARELTGTYGLRGAPPRLAYGWQEVPLRAFTGILDESGREAFLRDRDGREQPISPLRAKAVASRAGHVVSAVWAQRENEPGGRELVVRNHTTDQVSYDEVSLRALLKPRGALHGLTWVAALAFALWSLTGPFVYMLATRTPSTAPFKTPSVAIGVAALVLAPIATGVLRSMLARARLERCKRQLQNRVLPGLDLDADDLLSRSKSA